MPNRSKPPDLQELHGLASLYEQITRSVYDRRAPNALQPAQWAALRFFSRAGSNARTVSGLARYLAITAGPASRATAALEKRGLIVAHPHPTDARSHVFDLTSDGEALLSEDPLLRLVHALRELNTSQKTVLTECLLIISEKVHSAPSGPADNE